jgi:hypothetical protein
MGGAGGPHLHGETRSFLFERLVNYPIQKQELFARFQM